MNRILAILLIGFVLSVSGGIACAGSLEDSIAAHERGDYAAALRLVLPLAEQGNAVAQYHLGFMYLKGEGVPENYEEAAKWFRLSAERGFPPCSVPSRAHVLHRTGGAA
jgi:uncharacterized protein